MSLNEEEYRIHVDNIAKNLISDEAAYIIDTRREYADFQDVYGILKEEVEETTEELTALEDALQEYWEFVRGNMPPEALLNKLDIIEDVALNIINEAKQVGAVAKKARMQLTLQKPDLENAAYKMGQAMRGYGKGSCHRPK